MKIILDTNIFTRDKARKMQNFTTLARLCAAGQIDLIVPYMVKREFETQLDVYAGDLTTRFKKSAKELLGGPAPREFLDAVKSAVEMFEKQQQTIVNSYRNDFNLWLINCQATEHAIGLHHVQAALESYFTGSEPYRSAKSREDIPDGLIYQAIEEFASTGTVAFVSADKQISSAAKKLRSVSHYKDLSTFIASKEIQDLIADLDNARFESITDMLVGMLDDNPLVGFLVDRGGEKLPGTYLHSYSIPSDDKEAYIESFGDLEHVELNWADLIYHGGMVYTIPFKAFGTFDISYYVSNYEIHRVEERGGSFSIHNDYVVEAHESTNLRVSGTLRFQISHDLSPDDPIEDAIEKISVDAFDEPMLLEDEHR